MQSDECYQAYDRKRAQWRDWPDRKDGPLINVSSDEMGNSQQSVQNLDKFSIGSENVILGRKEIIFHREIGNNLQRQMKSTYRIKTKQKKRG